MAQPPPLAPDQCRAARHLLGWDIFRLASEAGTGLGPVVAIETGAGCEPEAVEAVRRVLEDAGVELVPGGARLVGPLHPGDGSLVRVPLSGEPPDGRAAAEPVVDGYRRHLLREARRRLERAGFRFG
jgi:hypothetical protein